MVSAYIASVMLLLIGFCSAHFGYLLGHRDGIRNHETHLVTVTEWLKSFGISVIFSGLAIITIYAMVLIPLR